MNQINIQFPDGNTKEFDKGTTTEDIAQSISPGLRKKQLWKIQWSTCRFNTPFRTRWSY